MIRGPRPQPGGVYLEIHFKGKVSSEDKVNYGGKKFANVMLK